MVAIRNAATAGGTAKPRNTHLETNANCGNKRLVCPFVALTTAAKELALTSCSQARQSPPLRAAARPAPYLRHAAAREERAPQARSGTPRAR
jgi:hypothetical protein